MSAIIVEKNGTVRRVSLSSNTLNVPELSKKCGFKSTEGFNCAHTWTIEFNSIEYKIQVFGKTNGKAGSENKYEFPPPIDNVLFFGNCAIVNMSYDKIAEMTANDFNDIMDYLQGGYSDVDNSDEDEDDEFEDDTDLPKTKEGYVKDDFIVDDDDDCDDDVSSSSEEPIKKKPKVVKSAKTDKVKKVDKTQIVKKKPVKPEPVVQPPTVFQCLDELVEEEYV
jgi:hypothetical protein